MYTKTPKEIEKQAMKQDPPINANEIISGVNSLLQSQPRPFMNSVNMKDREDTKDDVPRDNFEVDSQVSVSDTLGDGDEEEELLEQVAENYVQMPHGNSSYAIQVTSPDGRYKRPSDMHVDGHTMSADYYQQMSQQVAHPSKKKKKRHRRMNTDHYYINVNFEQVNNILVSYGGEGHK